MRIVICIILGILLSKKILSQVEYEETNFRPPLNIPLILAGNFAELRPNHFHTGIDIKTNHKEGYRIYSIDTGYVSRINISHWGYGKTIYITHTNGYTSVYAHLRNFPKKIEKFLRKKQFENQTETIDFNLKPTDIPIKKGEIIAYSGNTGSSTAPHLHFEIRETKTEYPVNPLLFNFDIKDNVKPSIFNIKLYPIEGSINGKFVEKTYATSGYSGKYILKNNPTITLNGNIGFGVHTIDKLNGANNKCGIYTIELKLDNKTVYKQTMEKLDFSTSRYINTHKDYKEYHTRKRSIHKSFKTPNNDLKIYSDLNNNNGIITFNKDTTHRLEYIIKDTYGNTSILNFKVKSTSKKHTRLSKKIENVFTHKPFVIDKEDVKVNMEPKTVYDNTHIGYSKEKTLYSSAPLHKIGNSKTPLQKYFVMKIKTQGVKSTEENKALVVKISNDKSKAFARGGTFKNGWVETKVRELGNYTVKIDSLPPVVKPINIYKNKQILSQKNIQFKITDNLSGIKTYKIFINDIFMHSNYNPRRSLLTLKFNEYNKINKGNNKLKIIVADERGNKTIKEYPFFKK